MEIFEIQKLVEYSDKEKVKKVLCKGGHARATLFCLEPGQHIHPHEHEGDHVWLISEGEGFFLTDKSESAVKAGDLVFAPQGEPHGIRAVTRLAFISVSAGAE